MVPSPSSIQLKELLVEGPQGTENKIRLNMVALPVCYDYTQKKTD